MNQRVKARTWVAGLIFTLTGILAGSAVAAGITGTKHDLSITGANTEASGLRSSDQTEICVFCHTPHAAIKNDSIPLWNHTLSTTASYGVYTSPTFNGGATDVGGVTEATAAVSNLCLSCHDGTVALNSLSNPSNARPTSTFAGTGMIPAGATNLGATADALKNDHPINFSYDTSVTADGTADGGLVAKASLAGVKLYDNKVQCASCHDPHTSADIIGGVQKAFLRVTMNASSLCFACHKK